MLQFELYPNPSFTTDRLQIKAIEASQAMDFHKLRSNAEVMEFIERPRTNSVEDAEAMIQKMEEFSITGNGITWGIYLKEQPQLIGTIGLYRIDKENHRTEIGYLLHPDYWHQGLMTEAIQCCIRYSFEQLNFHTIIACINPENENSRRILLKNQFIQEGFFKESMYFEGKFYDAEYYTLFKKTYLVNQTCS